MPRHISGIFLDFDNVFTSLHKQSKDAAKEFATNPAGWLRTFQGMQGSETEGTSHNFVARRCDMNPSVESEPGHKANVSGSPADQQFLGITEDWASQRSLSPLLKKVCKLKVDQVENKTLAWKE